MFIRKSFPPEGKQKRGRRMAFLIFVLGTVPKKLGTVPKISKAKKPENEVPKIFSRS